MKKGLGLFGKKAVKRRARKPANTQRQEVLDLDREYYENDLKYENDDYPEEDYREDEDYPEGDYREEEDYPDEDYREDDDYFDDEDDIDEDEYTQEELEEYYEKTGDYPEEMRNSGTKEEPQEPQEPLEPDYEFTDDDYMDDEVPEEDYAEDDYPERDSGEDGDYPEEDYPERDYEDGDYPEDDYREDEDYPEDDYGGDDDYPEDDRYEDYPEEDYPERDFYEEDYYEDDDDKVAVKREKKPRKTGNKSKSRNKKKTVNKNKILAFILNTSAVERIAAVFALMILVGAVVMTISFASAANKNDKIGEFASVGTALEDVEVVGQSGLLAVADAQRARAMAAAYLSSEEEPEPEEPVEEENVVINMTLTTIKSDIKVKFISSETGKLVGDVPFEINVTNPDGTKVTYDDHDRDGIIYKTKLTAGKYTVTPKELPDSYSKYALNLETKTITVKDTVAMQAVDVKNEIKKESQVNVAKEEAGKNQETESELPDTVDWDGESWVKDGEGDGSTGYQEIKKSDVPAPGGSASITVGGRTALAPANNTAASEELTDEGSAEETIIIAPEPIEPREPVNPEEPEEPKEPEDPIIQDLTVEQTEFNLEVGQTAKIKVKEKVDIDYSSDDESVATVDSSGKITAVGVGKAIIFVEAFAYNPVRIEVNVIEKQEPVIELEKIPLETLSLELKVKETAVITCKDSSIKLSFESANTDIATVNKKGKVTAVKEGDTFIIVTASGYEQTDVAVKVIGEEVKFVLPIDIKSVTLSPKQTKKITVKDIDAKLSFKTSDKKVAKVDEDGTITAVKDGKCKITVSADGYEDYVIDVTVSSQELKDKDGNVLYVRESDGKYRAATTADYDKFDVFYKKVENKKKIYHGWATIDGKTYFYDNSGNYVTGEQVINHVKYTFGSDGVLAKSAPTVGIDVSKHNGNIDWKAVKNSGVNFVIIRCGYRGYSTGVMVEDPLFRTNIKGALAAGLRVGVYYYSQAVDEVEAVEEASMCVNLLSGYGIQLPVYMDVEGSGGRGDKISVSQRTANIKAFCGTIQNAGYKAGVYGNKTWLTSYINTSQLTNYNIWLAQYAKEPSYGATRYDMWQYTSKGRVSGINGKVDMNICY